MIIHFTFWKASQKFTTLMKLNKLWLVPWRERITCLELFERSLQWSQTHWKFQVICIVVRDSDVLCLINWVCSFSQEKSRIGQVVLLLNKGLFSHVRYYEWCDCVSFKSFTSQLTPKFLAHFFHCVDLNKISLTNLTHWTLLDFTDCIFPLPYDYTYFFFFYLLHFIVWHASLWTAKLPHNVCGTRHDREVRVG